MVIQLAGLFTAIHLSSFDMAGSEWRHQLHNALGNIWQVSMPGPATCPPQEVLNPVITHVPLKYCLTTISSSPGTVNFCDGSLIDSIESSEQRVLFAGEPELEVLGVEIFEGRPEGIDK